MAINYNKELAAKATVRRAKMQALLNAGWTMAAIGRRFRISRQRVRAILLPETRQK
ncbi:MAG: hypothetical protein KGL39_44295 [Patescibacteria group bacterium]|nr:hypothetical protein [Patescibacteria group bacterium]